MSDDIVCPYCGNTPWSGVSPRGDSSMRVRCDRCGGVFEYIPGFGAFSLPEMGRQTGTMGDLSGDSYIPTPGPQTDRDRYGFPSQDREQNQGNSCCGACCCFLLLFFMVPYFIYMILSIFG
jgi:hypothetical protein